MKALTHLLHAALTCVPHDPLGIGIHPPDPAHTYKSKTWKYANACGHTTGQVKINTTERKNICFQVQFVTLLMTPPDAGWCGATKYHVLVFTWER